MASNGVGGGGVETAIWQPGADGGASAFTATTAKGMELSAYDQQRRAHPPIDDNTEIVVTPRSLSAELCCPICLDLLANTMTTKVGGGI